MGQGGFFNENFDVSHDVDEFATCNMCCDLLERRTFGKEKNCVIFYAFWFVSKFVCEYLSHMFYLFYLLRNNYAVFLFYFYESKSKIFSMNPSLTPAPIPAPVGITSNPARPQPLYFELLQPGPAPAPIS